MFMMKKLSVLLFIAAAPAALFAKTPPDQLVIGLSMNNILTLDPAAISGREATGVVSNLYDTLVDLDPLERGKILPNLAGSWNVEGDSISFQLRPDLKFASGNPLTADDVVWSIRRNIALGLVGSGKWAAFGYNIDNIDSLLSANADTVTLRLASPGDPNLILMLLAQPDVAAVIDRKLVEENAKGEDLGAEFLRLSAAGSAPFVLQSYRSNELLVLNQNENYWGDAPAMRRVLYKHMAESQTKRLQMERGDIDVAIGMAAPDIQAIEASGSATVQSIPSSGFYFLAMSTKDEKFANPDVRKAIISAIDYDGINGAIMQYYGEKRLRPVAGNVLGALPDPEYKVDVEGARQLLTAAGYAEGFSTRILALNEPPFANIATAVQANLAEIGIRAEVVQGTGDTVYGPMRARNFEIVIGRGGGGQEPHPHSNLRALVINPNNADGAKLTGIIGWRTAFYDQQLNDMAQAALEERDRDTQVQMYHDIQTRYEDLAPALQPISAVQDTVVLGNNVTGYQNHFAWTVHLQGVTKE